MFRQSSNNGWVVHAPAKINLALEVLGRQPDGYHQVETLLVPVRLCDTLVYHYTSSPLACHVRGTHGIATAALRRDADDNLAVRAMRLLSQHSGHPATGRLTLTKRIPLEAGLGGGSSDAAAALALANHAWQLGYTRSQLLPLAEQLGTDVPFFLLGGAALGTGRGEQVTPVAAPSAMPLVITKPTTGLSTPEVFAALGLARGEQHPASEHVCQQLAACLAERRPIAAWRHLVRNSLQTAATKLNAWIETMAAAIERLPVVAHQMTGSGSAYFAMCRNWSEAQRLAAYLRGRLGQWTIATRTCP